MAAKATEIPRRIKRYFRENWGASFVIGFQVLLLVCACLLIQGNSALANEVAVYAYCLLVAGVILQMICFIRHSRVRALRHRRVRARLIRHGRTREREEN